MAGNWGAPFFAGGAFTTDAGLFTQSPKEVIETFLAAAARPPATPTQQTKRGLFGRRPATPPPEFRLDLRPASLGWMHDERSHGLTVWLFVVPDGRTLLMLSPWNTSPDSSWPFERSREIFEPLRITLRQLSGVRLRREGSTKQEWAEYLQSVLSESRLVEPRELGP